MSKSRFTSVPIEAVCFAWMCSPELTTVPEVLTPQRLSELPVIAISREWQFRGSALTWVTANDVHFRHLTICNTFHTASLAAAGLGLAYLPEEHCRTELETGSLRRLPFDREPSRLQICADDRSPMSSPLFCWKRAAESAAAAMRTSLISGRCAHDDRLRFVRGNRSGLERAETHDCLT